MWIVNLNVNVYVKYVLGLGSSGRVKRMSKVGESLWCYRGINNNNKS